MSIRDSRFRKATMTWFRLACLVWLGFFLAQTALAADADVTLGVLAFRPKPETMARWQPTADYLSQATGRHFKLVAYDYPELEDAVRNRRIDFVLTNAAHYVLMTKRNGLSSPLATLLVDDDGIPLAKVGGVIVTRADRSDLNGLADLRGRVIATPGMGSLGGYMVQAYELVQTGLSMPGDVHLLVTGMPHDTVIRAVLDGRADAGFVRTSLIESMQREGKLDLRRIKVLHPVASPGFPYRLSTGLYPEWPFAAMPQVDEALAREVTAALYAIPENDPAAKAGGYYGWLIPADYEPVRALLQALRLPPYDTAPAFTWLDVFDKHRRSIATAAFALLLAAMLVGFRAMRHRQVRLQEQHLAEIRRQLLSALGEGVYGVEKAGTCTFINPAALTMLGFTDDEVLGQDQHRLFHHHYPNGRDYPADRCPVHLTLQDGQLRYIEEWLYRKDGSGFPVEMTVSPMERGGERTGAVVVFRDISERKRLEAELQALATTDALTGLPNRRHFLAQLDQEAARIRRFDGAAVALLMLDLDHFKAINDSHGHATGDKVLQNFGRAVLDSLRKTDMAGRLGGEEFAILLVGTGQQEAQDFAERLRKHIAETAVAFNGGRLHYTVSIGVTTLRPDDASIDDTLARADDALYRAKGKGRNAVEPA